MTFHNLESCTSEVSHLNKVNPKKVFRKITKTWNKLEKPSLTKINVITHANSLPLINVILKNGSKLSAMLDSGSTCNIISKQLFENLSKQKLILKNIVNKSQNSLFAANNTEIVILSECLLKIKIENNSWKVHFLVTNLDCCDMILGVPFFTKTKLILNLANKSCFFSHKPLSKIPIISNEKICESLNCIHVGNLQMQKDVDLLIKKYPEVFSNKIGKALNLTVDIELTDSEVVNIRPYYLNPPTLHKVKKIINEWLEEGIIEPSTSSYSSPAFLTKNDRLVINYNSLNKKIRKVNYPLGDMQNMYQHLQGAHFFSVLDLKKSFLQCPISEKSKHLTAFSFIHAKYQFLRIPFGLQIGSSQLSAYLDQLFSDIKFEYMLNFCDDIVVYSKDKESHLKHLEEVFFRLSSNNLTVNMEKAKFFCTEISFLGNIISHNRVAIDQSRTVNIKNFPEPRCVRDIKRFLGMTGFFSRYIDNYASICLPLNNLRKKNVKFKFDLDCQKSFELLKEKISNPPVLAIADFSKPFVLMSDASATTAGGCLLQRNENNDLLPIAYYSKKFTDAEIKYSVFEKEALSVILCINKWEEFLSVMEFKLICDNKALVFVLNAKKKLNSRLSRWVESLLQLPFEVEFIKGGENVLADALSRMYERVDESSEGKKEPISKCESESIPLSVPTQTNPTSFLPNSTKNINQVIKFKSINKSKSNQSLNSNNIEIPQKLFTNLISDIPLAFTELKTHQCNDDECNSIIESIKNNTHNLSFFMKNDVLMYKSPKGSHKVFLPINLVNLVFAYYHSSLIGGHLGLSKTLAKIQEYFYRPGLYDLIREKTQSCTVCKMSKSCQRKYQGQLISHPITDVMNTVFVDLCGPFSRSKLGNKYLLVVVDSFSRFVWISAIKNCTSEYVISKLKSVIFDNFGYVQNLVSDNGSCFTSHMFKKFCFKNYINQRLIAPYRAQSNKCERFIRNLMQTLRCFYSTDQRNYDQDLGLLQCALNTAKSEATGYTPFDLMFNRQPICALSNLWKLNDLVSENKSKEDIVKTLDRAVQNVKRSIRLNNQRARYSDKMVKHPFKLQSLVYVKTHFLSNKLNYFSKKLANRYEGPYRILYFISPVTCLIQRCNDLKVIKKVPICDLKVG